MSAKQWPEDDGGDIVIPQESADWFHLAVGVPCIPLGVTAIVSGSQTE